MWQQWANGVLGLAILIVPFLGLSTETAAWTVALMGVLVAALGFWGASEHMAMMESQGGRARMA